MLITREQGPDKKIQFRIRMNEKVFNEISEYCLWADIRFRDYFIEQACKYIFENDADWKQFKSQQDKNKEKDI
ncbi:MAG: hypothetical protein LCH30_11640 [Proteobacteria bacterium]|nr:hypothetical protein [Pseudomonadota bacterium]